ncbi:MAG: hypothetical protein ABI222_16185 [Opitutaceae bacterium]
MKTQPLRSFLAPALAAGCLLLAACNSTTLESSWKAPAVDSIHFTKVLVVAASPVDSLRRMTEDAMKAQITTVPVVTSYELLPNRADAKDRTKLAALIKSSGVDGIIIMRLVSDANEVTYVAGTPMPMPYRSFYGYYNRPYGLSPYFYDPGSIRTDRVVSIETNIYDAKDESLIWSGVTKTTNPENVEDLVAQVTKVVRAKLRAQKLIPESPKAS